MATSASVSTCGVTSSTALLGVYGKTHEPSAFSVNVAGFSGPQAVKAWLATVALIVGRGEVV
ncbi:DUF6529 family protein [Nocardia brasiliensis]|uniref:DUF6529 family protein n=1 Tax=Nocardia brasiliensis TaxID=37326 RepID=UPI0032AF2B38